MNEAARSPLDSILDRLRQRLAMNSESLAVLEETSSHIRTSASQYEKPDEVQNLVHEFSDYLAAYSSVLKRLIEEVPHEITEEHVNKLRRIAKRNETEQQRCFQFQRVYIARGINTPEASKALNRVYESMRERTTFDKQELGALLADMLRYAEIAEHEPHDVATNEEKHSPSDEEPEMKPDETPTQPSVAERAYKAAVSFLVTTHLGRAIGLAVFVAIGISLGMNYSQPGRDMIESLSEEGMQSEELNQQTQSQAPKPAREHSPGSQPEPADGDVMPATDEAETRNVD